MDRTFEHATSTDLCSQDSRSTHPPPPQYPFQSVRKERTRLRQPSSGRGTFDSVSGVPSERQGSAAIRPRFCTAYIATPTAGCSVTAYASQTSYLPRVPPHGGGTRPSVLHSPALTRRQPNTRTCSTVSPKSPSARSATLANTDSKGTPLLSRLLAPGFASSVGSSLSGLSSTPTSSVQTTANVFQKPSVPYNTSGSMGCSFASAQEPLDSDADRTDSQFIYHNSSSAISPRHGSQRLTNSSPDSDGSVQSTRESSEMYFDKSSYGDQMGTPRRTLSSQPELVEPSRCYVTMEEADEQDSELNDKSVDSNTQVPIRSDDVTSFPETFHRLSHSYVNEDQVMSVCHSKDGVVFYEDHMSPCTRPPHDLDRSIDKRADASQGVHFIQNKERPEICIEESAPPLHPRQSSFCRAGRHRSQSSSLRDYVNIPEAALVNWLATTVTTHLPLLNNGVYYLGQDNHVPEPISGDRIFPAAGYSHPPPPPYRPHPSMGPGLSAHYGPLRPSDGTLCHVAENAFAYSPFSAAAFAVISTAATCQAPGLVYFRPQWIVQRSEGLTDQHPLEPSIWPASQHDHDFHHEIRKGFPLVADVPPMSASFAITTALSSFSPRLTAVSSWTMHCCARAPPTIICDNLIGPDKLESISVPGQGASDSSPSTQNPPGESDINQLRRENQKLRALLREATTRLQYVDVLEWHLQRLSVLVESMLASHHRQCELDHQLHNCVHPNMYSTESRPPGPYVSPSMPPMEFIHQAASANPGGLPSAPAFVPYCPVIYHPFHTVGSTGMPIAAADKPHVAPVSAGYHAYHQGHHVHEMEYDSDFHLSRTSRPRVNTPAWPRTVSLDRVNGVGFMPGYGAQAFRHGWGFEKHPHRERYTDYKAYRVADDLTVLPKKQLVNPPTPFRSVQVTRRRLINPQRPSAPVPSDPHTNRVNFGIATPHVKRRFPLSNNCQLSSRPMGVSLITRQPDMDDEETIKYLNPHTENLPVKVSVSSVYQIASAYRVCLADSGTQPDEIRLPSAAHLTPPVSRTIQSTSNALVSSHQGNSVFSHDQTQADDVAPPLEPVLSNCESAGFQNCAKSVGYSHTNASTEADGSGSYEGISLPRPLNNKQSDSVRQTKGTSSSNAQYISSGGTSSIIHRVDPGYVPRSPLGHVSRYQLSCSHAPVHTAHSIPLCTACPRNILQSHFQPEGRAPTLADWNNTSSKTYLDPHCGWPVRPPVTGACRMGDTQHVVDTVFTPAVDQPIPSQSTTPVCYRRPHRSITCVPNSASADNSTSKSAPQVHFASPEPSSPSPMYGPPFMADPIRPPANSRRFTIDSIVSPHLLRKQYC